MSKLGVNSGGLLGHLTISQVFNGVPGDAAAAGVYVVMESGGVATTVFERSAKSQKESNPADWWLGAQLRK